MNLLPHVLVADEVWRKLGWPQELRGPMMLGAIAPDVHRIVPGMTYRDTHYRSRTRLGLRQVDFIQRYLHPAFDSLDTWGEAFFSGWLTHLCADDAWRQRLRGEHQALWDGVHHATVQQARDLKRIYRENCALVDFELAQALKPQIEEIRWHLTGATAKVGVGAVRAKELTRWQNIVLTRGLGRVPKHDANCPRIIDYDFVLRAMAAAEDNAYSAIVWECQAAERSVLDDSDYLA